jgi:predicted PhzF superfamily epimerase YddE/YHI9
MKRYPYYEVSAFTTGGTNEVFSGNPAGVVLLDEPLQPATMQRVAEQNNLAETAFVVPEGDGFRIRWFTPTSEIDLCGHATLGSAYALMLHGSAQPSERPIRFYYEGGTLEVAQKDGLLTMNFPLVRGERMNDVSSFEELLGTRIEEAYLGRDLALILPSEQAVRDFSHANPGIAKLPGLGCIVTARGSEHDFVSRAFFPELGIVEDPVTGSAHCFLAWIWGKKLPTDSFHAYQASPRGGELWIQTRGDRVILQGRAHEYLRGEILIPSYAAA